MTPVFNLSLKRLKPLVLVSVVVSWVLLHMDVIQERLEREFNIDLIMTAPSVITRSI